MIGQAVGDVAEELERRGIGQLKVVDPQQPGPRPANEGAQDGHEGVEEPDPAERIAVE